MLQRLEKLIDVKSIMTLMLTAGFVGLTCAGEISGDQFLTLFTMIVGFYFGTQAQKNRSEKQKSGERNRNILSLETLTIFYSYDKILGKQIIQ